MEEVFEPFEIGEVAVANRFVRSARHLGIADAEGFLPSEVSTTYRELAEGEAGLIITGYAFVERSAKASAGQAGIYDNRFIETYADRVVAAVRGSESKIFLQVAHAGHQIDPDYPLCESIGPSAVFDPVTKLTAREMDEEEIEHAIDAHVQAVRRGKEAGFDGVQIHCAHGYLPGTFFSPARNLRKDRWGGSMLNRVRFACEIVRRSRAEVGGGYPIAVKMNGCDFIEGGLDLPEAATIARELAGASVSLIEVSGGTRQSWRRTIVPDIVSEDQEAYFREYGKAIRDAVGIPVALVGGIRSCSTISKILAGGLRRLDLDVPSVCR